MGLIFIDMNNPRLARTFSITVDGPAEQVYAFVRDPGNLPRWATQLARSVHRDGEDWVVQTPNGRAVIRFTEANGLGVLDHVVRLESGVEVAVPMRVIPNGPGSEVLFTLFRLPGTTDEDFARDAGMVQNDLRTLKRVLES